MSGRVSVRLLMCEACYAHGRILLDCGSVSREFSTKGAGERLAGLHREAGHLSLENFIGVKAEIERSSLAEEEEEPTSRAMTCAVYVKRLLELHDKIISSRLLVH